MKHVSILVPKGKAVLSSIVGPYKVFKQVNEYLIKNGIRKDKFFNVELVGLSKETALYDGIFKVCPDKTIDKVKKTDLIIISAISGDIMIIKHLG